MRLKPIFPGINKEAFIHMEGLDFEDLCLQIYKHKYPNAHVQKTDINDFGADLLVTLDEGRKIVIQCKITEGSKKQVGVKAIQEVLAAKEKYGADFAQVVSNSYFTDQAKELAEGNVYLMDIDALMNYCFITVLEISDLRMIYENFTSSLTSDSTIYFNKYIENSNLVFEVSDTEIVYAIKLALSNVVVTSQIEFEPNLMSGIRHMMYLAIQSIGN